MGRAALWIFLGLIAALTMLRLSPPPARPFDAPAEVFSAGRARVHVEAIARRPHPVGSEAAREVEQYIVRYLTELGLRVELQTAPACTTLAELRRCAHVRNVIATFPGRDATAAVLLSAHYDTVPNAPGAADDGAGVAALLETARALTAGPRLAHDVIFAFVDGEEELLLGSTALAQSNRLSNVVLAANFEARGSRGASVLFAVSKGRADVVRALAEILDRPVMNSFFSTVASLLPNATDAEIYDRFGVPTLSFAFVQGFERYHQGTDTPDNLDLDSLEHHGRYALAIAKHFANVEPSPAPAADDVFFDIGGWFVVHYPYWLARVLAAVLAFLLVKACVFALRHGRTTVKALGSSSALFVAFIVATAVLATFGTRLMTAGWPLWSPFVHAGAIATCLGCITVGAFLWLLGFERRRWGDEASALGPLAVMGLASAAVGALAPGASHVYVWPALGSTLFVLSQQRRSEHGTSRWRDGTAFLALLPTFVLQAQVIYTTVAVIGGAVMAIPLVCAGLSLGYVAPVILARGARHVDAPRVERRAPIAWAAIGFIAAVVLAYVGRARSAPKVGNSMALAVDPVSRAAFWVSADRENDEWKRQFLGDAPARGHLAAFSSGTALYYRPAPSLDLPAPSMAIASDATTESGRQLALRMQSPRGARTMVVWETTGAEFEEWTFDGRAPLPIVRFSEEIDRKGFELVSGLGYGGHFVLTMHAIPAEGTILHLRTRAQGPLEFRVMDASDDLAHVPATVQPRGERWTAGHPGDATWVSGSPLRIAPRLAGN